MTDEMQTYVFAEEIDGSYYAIAVPDGSSYDEIIPLVIAADMNVRGVAYEMTPGQLRELAAGRERTIPENRA